MRNAVDMEPPRGYSIKYVWFNDKDGQAVFSAGERVWEGDADVLSRFFTPVTTKMRRLWR
jgi:hypothetical protein